MSIEYFNYFLWNSTVNEPIRLLRWRLVSKFCNTWLVNSRSYRLATASNTEIQNVFWNGSAKFGWWYRSRVSTKRRQLQLGRIRWHRRADSGPTWLCGHAPTHDRVLRTVELSSEGVSEVGLTLESIGGSENGPDYYVCKNTEARYELACAVLLCSATSLWLPSCVFSLVSRSSGISVPFHGHFAFLLGHHTATFVSVGVFSMTSTNSSGTYWVTPL